MCEPRPTPPESAERRLKPPLSVDFPRFERRHVKVNSISRRSSMHVDLRMPQGRNRCAVTCCARKVRARGAWALGGSSEPCCLLLTTTGIRKQPARHGDTVRVSSGRAATRRPTWKEIEKNASRTACAWSPMFECATRSCAPARGGGRHAASNPPPTTADASQRRQRARVELSHNLRSVAATT